MANAFNQNPMILDTVWSSGTIPAALTALSSGNPQAFTKIVWQGGTLADTIVITDASAGTFTLFSDTCPATGQDVVLWQNSNGKKYTFKQGLWVLKTMAHGQLLLYK